MCLLAVKHKLDDNLISLLLIISYKINKRRIKSFIINVTILFFFFVTFKSIHFDGFLKKLDENTGHVSCRQLTMSAAR